MRKTAWIYAACLTALLSACGGGGDDDGDSASPTQITPAPQEAPAAGGPSATPSDSAAPNAIPVTVGNAPGRPRNFPVVSVTVCAPGSNAGASCATIDNVLLDTGSYGLRLYASAIPADTLAALEPQRIAGAQVASCAIFVDSHAWGTVRNADVRMASQVAQNVPIHVWSDPGLPASSPAACQLNSSMDTVADLGGNGILGVGVAPADCPGCSIAASGQFYYSCTGAVCTPAIQPLANQIGNPVSRFADHNNGIVLQMEPIGSGGKSVATGTLVFGVDTAANNVLAGRGATVLRTDGSGGFEAVYKGVRMRAFTDSGSNGYFFGDADLPHSRISPDFYAPEATQSLSLWVLDRNAAAGTTGAELRFDVANADSLFATGNAAFNNLAGDVPGAFDLGLPFFYGRHVYYGLTGRASAGGGSGPYVGYAPQ
ncbi:DUF3443 family protein [Bordetella genomosp. 13]|uniref:DUF3443 domain-containing protein n=1 Tax=Bordetella genomosp. 13 TaxID=463040 RepID=A0A1W6Z9F4_9BORD|nr:DUF3443 family protein [Bordetella genomosp. 13]ARP94026.1 hypothetical protein CAL15_06305 [Bordetella genomosp. 13]